MNANEITTILFILGILGTLLNALIGIVPVEYTAIVTLALGILSEVTNYLKSGYQAPGEIADESN